MTKDEALKLALEAMEASHFLIHGSETKGGLAFCMDGYYSGCFDIDSNDKQTNKAIAAIKEALAQPKHCSDCGQKLGDANHIHTCSPQRTWVGLTPDELNAIFDGMKTWSSFQITDVYFAIEAKLKEKNT
jgi:hypothetical protein